MFLNQSTAASFDKGCVPARIPGIGSGKKRSCSVEDRLEHEVEVHVEEEGDGSCEEGVEVSKWAVVRGLQ